MGAWIGSLELPLSVYTFILIRCECHRMPLSGYTNAKGDDQILARRSQGGTSNWLQQPSSQAYASSLRWCVKEKALSEGRCIHLHMVRNGHDKNVFLGNLIVQMYGKCRALDEARQAFDEMGVRNVFTWNVMMTAYIEHGRLKEAIDVFLNIPQPNVVSWTIMISAYVQIGLANLALKMFRQMQLQNYMPNKVTFIIALDACSNQLAMSEGKRIHACIIENAFQIDVLLGTALVDMYGKCGCVNKAYLLFWKLPERNVFTWSSIIASYARIDGNKALQLSQEMQLERVKPNRVTYISILDACANEGALGEGKRMHAFIVNNNLEQDIKLGTALLNMYGRCGNLEGARAMFEIMRERNVISWTSLIASYIECGMVSEAYEIFLDLPERDNVSWTTMISGCSRHGYGEKAIQLFEQMQGGKLLPDKYTFSSILEACAREGALVKGRHIHTDIICRGYNACTAVSNALVFMYGKCGSLDDARAVFDEMFDRDLISWNAMIATYAQYGNGKDALDLCQKMHGILTPDQITLGSIISACNHAGLVNDGFSYLISMTQDYAITPSIEHYNCTIDLLGRAGQVDEGHDLIHNMWCHPVAGSWVAFLGACRTYRHLEHGKHAVEHIIQMDPENDIPSFLPASLFSDE